MTKEQYEKRKAVRRVRGIMEQLPLDLRQREEWLEEDIESKKWAMNPEVRYSSEK
jgi:hypothetical protein